MANVTTAYEGAVCANMKLKLDRMEKVHLASGRRNLWSRCPVPS